MADVIAQDTSGYEQISEKIASTVNQAFQDLLKELVEEENLTLLGTDRASVNQADLDNFLTVLGSAYLEITFTPKLSRWL